MSKNGGIAVYAVISLLLAALAAAPKYLNCNKDTIIIIPESTKTVADTTASETTVSEPVKAASRPARTTIEVSATSDTIETSANDSDTPLYLDINTATAEELSELDGIGEMLGSEIVRYRSDHGFFTSIEDIMNVPGIGQARFDAICSNIYVSAEFEEQYSPEEPEEEEPLPPDDDAVPTDDEPFTEEADTEETVTEEPDVPEVLNINTASAEELMALPGISEECAGNIIALREKIGGFSNVYELLLCEDMTDQLFLSIREHLTVDTPE